MGSLGVSDIYAPNGVKGSSYQIIEKPSRIARKIRIIVMGCGASAINFVHEVDNSRLNPTILLGGKE
ncbi:hypothetical protein EYZ11_004063 [Aspergillus tanneri]|nr:hypothetical protein EYZ11_004063 [Aspergillus tanneri]